MGCIQWRLQGSTLTMVADLALGVVMPIHSHISVNGVISDYVPKAYMGVVSILGMTPPSYHHSPAFKIICHARKDLPCHVMGAFAGQLEVFNHGLWCRQMKDLYEATATSYKKVAQIGQILAVGGQDIVTFHKSCTQIN